MASLSIATLVKASVVFMTLLGTSMLAAPLTNFSAEPFSASARVLARDDIVAEEGTVLIDHGGQKTPTSPHLDPIEPTCAASHAGKCRDVSGASPFSKTSRHITKR